MRVDNALNCPLCDSDDVGVYSDMMGVLSVGCNDCGCDGPTRDTRDEAIAAWNKRPREDAILTKLGQLVFEKSALLNACDELVDFIENDKYALLTPEQFSAKYNEIYEHHRAAITKAKREE